MTSQKCPVCGCARFYVKNPEDQYDICEFDCIDGRPVFDPELDEDQCPEVSGQTETYCNQCAWHGPFQELG